MRSEMHGLDEKQQRLPQGFVQAFCKVGVDLHPPTERVAFGKSYEIGYDIGV